MNVRNLNIYNVNNFYTGDHVCQEDHVLRRRRRHPHSHFTIANSAMAFASPTTTIFRFGTHTPVVNRNQRLLSVSRPRQSGAAKIFALGAAPPPPPPPPEKDSESTSQDVPLPSEDVATPSEPVSDSSVSNGTAAEDVSADDILSSPSFLKKKLEIVQKELTESRESLAAAEKQLAEEKSSYLRLVADFENFRRRNAVDFSKLESKSIAKVCKGILGVLDNFDRAIEAVTPETEREESIQKSYSAINKQLMGALVKLEVEGMDPLGEPFDPEYHEAISQEESTEYAENIVSAVYSKGYKIGDNLVRPAVVAVSTGPGPEKIDGEEENKTEIETEKQVTPEPEQPKA